MDNRHFVGGKTHYFYDMVIFNSYVTNYQRVANELDQ